MSNEKKRFYCFSIMKLLLCWKKKIIKHPRIKLMFGHRIENFGFSAVIHIVYLYLCILTTNHEYKYTMFIWNACTCYIFFQPNTYMLPESPSKTRAIWNKSCKFACASSSLVKFIYSEKATKFCKISTNYLCYVLPVK